MGEPFYINQINKNLSDIKLNHMIFICIEPIKLKIF